VSQGSTNNRAFVYQIFYDEKSKAMLDPGFIPLDNTANERPDWFEFWVIYQFLMHNDLEPDCWYGFLSPRFHEKTKFTSQIVFDTLKQSAEGEVALFSPHWDMIAIFLNVFEHGEYEHPGLTNLSQGFCNSIGLDVQLRKLVNCASNAVFSNYIVAKPRFWERWLWMADHFFELVEHEAPKIFSLTTAYGLAGGQAPMKTFIQERFASIILSTEKFSVLTPAPNQVPMEISRMFHFDEDTVSKLQMCEQLKSEFNKSNDPECLEKFRQVRETISFRKPWRYIV
jgi:hypothetical protein